MSIDAIINKVTQEDNNLILDLMSRELSGLRGQPQLIIENFSHVPKVGQVIWGGSGFCIIEPGYGIAQQKQYQRKGLIRLLEIL